MAAPLIVNCDSPRPGTSRNGREANGKRAMQARRRARDKDSPLSIIDIFSDLSAGELAEMNGQVSTFACEPGRLLYVPGERAEALFLLGRGHVQLYRLSPGGRKLVVATLKAGTFFGAIPPVAQETYQTYAETVDPCVMYVLGCDDAQHLLREKPEVAYRVVAVLGERLQQLERRLEAMAFQNIPARLANLLLRLADEQGDGVVLGYTHQDLADMLGTYRETVSETLHKFRAAGLVHTGRREVGLKDRQQLETVADS